jgi:ABC-type Na+ transport system ATPase subunit NatA
MSKEVITEVQPLVAKGTSQKTKKSLLSFKEALFQNMTAQEALSVFDKMTYDLLGSDFAEDTTYRGEILVLQSIIHKAMRGIDQNINPNDIHVLQIEVQY